MPACYGVGEAVADWHQADKSLPQGAALLTSFYPSKLCRRFPTPFQSPGIGLQDNFTGDLLVLLGSSTG